MENLIINVLPKNVAVVCNKNKVATLTLLKNSASIAFIMKVLISELKLKFAIVKGQFMNEKGRLLAQDNILRSV